MEKGRSEAYFLGVSAFWQEGSGEGIEMADAVL